MLKTNPWDSVPLPGDIWTYWRRWEW